MLKASSEESPKTARHKWLLPKWEEHNRDVLGARSELVFFRSQKLCAFEEGVCEIERRGLLTVA